MATDKRLPGIAARLGLSLTGEGPRIEGVTLGYAPLGVGALAGVVGASFPVAATVAAGYALLREPLADATGAPGGDPLPAGLDAAVSVLLAWAVARGVTR